MAGVTLTREGLGIPASVGRLGNWGGTVGIPGAGGGGGGMVGGGGGGGGVLTGAPPRGGSGAAGQIPQVTNPSGTILGSLGNIGGAISGITAQQLQALRSQYPTEYFATLQQLLLNTQRRAGGDISDLLPEMWTKNAENAVGGGFSGSAMENSKRLRDMGLTRYGVEEQALKDLGLIQSGTPTVKPFDPSAIIAGIINAQERADVYRAAPDPELAYRRARDAARGGGGGGGGGGPGGGVRPGTLGGGGAGSSVDDILKRYGTGFAPPFMVRGTAQPNQQGLSPAPFGSIPAGPGAWEGEDEWLKRVFDTEDDGGVGGSSLDFGGGLDYGGGGGYYDEAAGDYGLFSGTGGGDYGYDDDYDAGVGGDDSYEYDDYY